MASIAKNIGSKAFGVVFGFDHDEAKIAKEIDAGYVSDIDSQQLGAPVEKHNPLGYSLDYASAFYMVLQGVIGTGIFLTPASVLKSIGSVGASYVLWVAGFIIAFFEVLVYIEFVSYFQRRSGGDVVYLEQAFPRPKHLVPTTFAAVNVILSFSTSSAVAFGTYILNAAEATSTAWTQRGVGIAALSFCCLLSAISSKYSARLSNLLGFVKMVTLIFIIITGFVVLGGGTSVKNPHKNFKNAWAGTTTDGNSISNAIIKVSFSFGGSNYVFAMTGEANPRTSKNLFRFFIPLVLVMILVIYLLLITTFYSGYLSVEAIMKSGSLVSSQFFQNVFLNPGAKKALDVLIALSALGHLNATTLAHSRSLREIGRQGVVPYPRLWTLVKPFGTPLLAIIITFIVNLIMLVAPPAGDAYNFIVDIGSYSGYIFKLLLFVGLFLVRRDRKAAGLGYEGWKTPLPVLVITILFYLFVIAMAWVPPKGTLIGSDVSFLYCAYPAATIGILLVCLLYYYVWAKILPHIGGYEHREKFYRLESGEVGHTVVQVKKEDINKWDTEHDITGRSLYDSDSVSVEEIGVVIEGKNKG